MQTYGWLGPNAILETAIHIVFKLGMRTYSILKINNSAIIIFHGRILVLLDEWIRMDSMAPMAFFQ